jgi:hypothetical protein
LTRRFRRRRTPLRPEIDLEKKMQKNGRRRCKTGVKSACNAGKPVAAGRRMIDPERASSSE